MRRFSALVVILFLVMAPYPGLTQGIMPVIPCGQGVAPAHMGLPPVNMWGAGGCGKQPCGPRFIPSIGVAYQRMDLDVLFGTLPPLKTERLLLRDLRPGDAASLFAVLGDEEVAEFYDDEVFQDVSQARQQIEAWTAGFKARRCVRWAIARRGDGELIGTCGYYGFHTLHRRAGIGYELGRAHWRQGIISCLAV